MLKVSALVKQSIFVLIIAGLCSCSGEKQLTSKRYKNAQEEIDRLKKELALLKDKQEKKDDKESQLKELNTSMKNALSDFKADELSVVQKDGKLYVSMTDKLLFKSGSATVEEKGRTALKKVAEVMAKNSAYAMCVEGHTDNVPIKGGLYKDNWDLSVARAVSVTRIICNDNKLDPKRVTAAGRGEFMPVAVNTTPEGRAKNRRTELIITPLEATLLP